MAHPSLAAAAAFEAEVAAQSAGASQALVPNGTAPAAVPAVATPAAQPVAVPDPTQALVAAVVPGAQPVPQAAPAPLYNLTPNPVPPPNLAPFDSAAAYQAAQHPTNPAQVNPVIADYETKLAAAEAARLAAEQRANTLERQNQFKVNPDDFTSLTPEAVAELQDKLIAPTMAQLDERHRLELEAQRNAYEARAKSTEDTIKQQSEAAQKARAASINGSIVTAHPDFAYITNTQEWGGFLDTPIPGTVTTYGEQLRSAYRTGDVNYINEAVAQFKHIVSAQPTLATIAASPTVGSAAGQLDSAPERVYTQKEFDEFYSAKISGRMSLETWQVYLKGFQEAELQGKVL